MSICWGRCLEFYVYLKSEQGRRQTFDRSWWLRHIPSTSHFALFLFLPLVLPTYARVYTSSTSNQAFFSVPCSLALSLSRWPCLTDHFPFSFSHRNFPAMYFSSVHFDLDISISLTFPAKTVQRRRSNEYWMWMLSTERAFRWIEWEVILPSYFLLRGLLLDSYIFFVCLCEFVRTLCIVLEHFNWRDWTRSWKRTIVMFLIYSSSANNECIAMDSFLKINILTSNAL